MSLIENDVFRGTLFAVIGFLFLLRIVQIKIRHIRSVKSEKATVTHVFCRGKGRYKYQPVYEYLVEGNLHKKGSNWGHRWPVAEDGAEVSLYYLSDKPDKIYVPAETRMFIPFYMFGCLFGTVSFVLGICVALGVVD